MLVFLEFFCSANPHSSTLFLRKSTHAAKIISRVFKFFLMKFSVKSFLRAIQSIKVRLKSHLTLIKFNKSRFAISFVLHTLESQLLHEPHFVPELFPIVILSWDFSSLMRSQKMQLMCVHMWKEEEERRKKIF